MSTPEYVQELLVTNLALSACLQPSDAMSGIFPPAMDWQTFIFVQFSMPWLQK